MNLVSIFVTAILTENIVLYYFLGLCPFMGVSNKEQNAVGMGIASCLVILCSSVLCYLLYYYILVPFQVTYLKTILFVLIIAFFVQLAELTLKRFLPKLYQALGIYLPLIATNCAVLGIVLMNIEREYSFLEMIIFSLGSSLGFFLVMYVFSTLREKLSSAPIGKYWKGLPIALVTAGIMAMIIGMYR